MCRVGRFTQTTSNGISLRGILANVTSLSATVSCPSYFRRLKTLGKDAAEGYVLRLLSTSAKVWDMIGLVVLLVSVPGPLSLELLPGALLADLAYIISCLSLRGCWSSWRVLDLFSQEIQVSCLDPLVPNVPHITLLMEDHVPCPPLVLPIWMTL